MSPEELSSNVKDGKLVKPFSATEMGLIYVNPECLDGKPDIKGAASAIPQAFSGMSMTDKETVALIAGGHTFGKTHGAVPADKVKQSIGPAPDKALIEQQSLDWHNIYGTGNGDDTMGSGLAQEFYKNPQEFKEEFAKAWFKLTHRDMGPKSRYIGPWIPKQDFIW